MFARAEAEDRRRSRTEARQVDGHQVDVVLLVREGPRFVLRASGNSLAPLRFTLAVDEPQGLSDAVERAVHAVLRLEAEFLGVLAYVGRPNGNRLLVAAVVRNDDPDLAVDRSLRLVAPAEIRSRRRDVEDAEHLEAAQQLLTATRLAPDLHSAVRRAVDASIAHLDDHLSVEGDLWGWNQYQVSSDLGTLSTGEALMAHVHAGVRGEYVDRPAETLEAHQNPDGGWQVRRSLVVAPSALSITESTCSCLLALAATGRSSGNEAARRGLQWLEEQQKPDSGWSSSAQDPDAAVFPTTTAVRALAAFGRTGPAARGVAWLRAAQCPDGGWGTHARAVERGQSSAPAYTAYAVVALLAAGVPPTDQAITRGCD
ncbi:MAG TPA: prenyltransferase/squalene oxidase repeat-containing protein, partial [Umezawaea sp.]